MRVRWSKYIFLKILCTLKLSIAFIKKSHLLRIFTDTELVIPGYQTRVLILEEIS